MNDDTGTEILHRELDTEGEDPAPQIAERVAGIEDKRITDMTTIYSCIDDMLTELFATPPSPEAQMEITFSYEGYRITVEQNGTVRFIKIA